MGLRRLSLFDSRSCPSPLSFSLLPRRPQFLKLIAENASPVIQLEMLLADSVEDVHISEVAFFDHRRELCHFGALGFLAENGHVVSNLLEVARQPLFLVSDLRLPVT